MRSRGLPVLLARLSLLLGLSRLALALAGLLALARLSHAQDLGAVLAVIEQHNPRLAAQRQHLAALGQEPAGGAAIVSLLERQQRSWLRYAQVTSGLEARVSPGQLDGSGVDARLGLRVAIPLDDPTPALALARERHEQAKAQQARADKAETARVAYATLRAALFGEAATQLGKLHELAATSTAIREQQAAKQQQRPVVAQRVETGVESRETLWRLDEQLQELARQQAVTQAQLQRVRLELALLAGDAWPQLLRQLGGSE